MTACQRPWRDNLRTVAHSARRLSVPVAQFGEHRLRLGDDALEERPALPRFEGKRLILGVRPEDVDDASLAADAPADQRISAVVDIREDMGSEIFVHFGVGGPAVRGEDVAAAMGEEALEATMEQARKKGSLWVGRLDRESSAREGDEIELVARRSASLLDPDTSAEYAEKVASGSA